MTNFIQDIIVEEDRRYEQYKSLLAPFETTLQAISIDTEIGNFTHYGNRSTNLNLIHPYVGTTSWVRAQPEGGTTYVAAFRSDQGAPQLLNTVQSESRKRIAGFKETNNLYRPLFSGEIELNSVGTSQLFLSRRPLGEFRGGLITRWADQDKLTSGDRAPLHHRQFLQNRSNDIVDESRTGIVSRPKDNAGTFSTWERCYPKVRGNFAAEDYIHLQNPANQDPVVLFRRHTGHVLDAKGTPQRQTRTQNALRHIEEYFANDDTSTSMQIDEKGNMAVLLAEAASEGYELSIPTGNYIKTVEFDEINTIRRNAQHTVSGAFTHQIGGAVEVNIGGDYHMKMATGLQELKMSSVANEESTSFKTKAHLITIDDTPGSEQISIKHKTGSTIDLDEKGAVKLTASDGTFLFLNPDEKAVTMSSSTGNWMTFRDDITMSTGAGTVTLGEDNIQLTSGQDILFQGPKVAVQGGAIELGNFASLSIALAEPLAVLFDSHIHASPVGPTGPPLPPFTATVNNTNPVLSFASDSVKVKADLT